MPVCAISASAYVARERSSSAMFAWTPTSTSKPRCINAVISLICSIIDFFFCCWWLSMPVCAISLLWRMWCAMFAWAPTSTRKPASLHQCGNHFDLYSLLLLLLLLVWARSIHIRTTGSGRSCISFVAVTEPNWCAISLLWRIWRSNGPVSRGLLEPQRQPANLASSW